MCSDNDDVDGDNDDDDNDNDDADDDDDDDDDAGSTSDSHRQCLPTVLVCLISLTNDIIITDDIAQAHAPFNAMM